MSEENVQGEENPKDDLAGLDEFEFYFSFTKPLVLDLPSSEDRAIAAAWVQKLEAEPESEEEKELRLNYLKLLLFVLQRGRLSGIFKKQPPSGPLQPFPQGFSIIDMGNWMLDQDDGGPCGGGDARSAPYIIEISNDLREFVASQEIPNFGIQMYYAWSSDEPIHKWSSFDEEKFPQFILDKIKQLKEIKSDEKSSISKGGCQVKKKGCDTTLQDKYSKKKVKSPQEIERSQGRSFHTYMGLVGRMGNFNDKCDDDPDKFQRQDQRKARKNPQEICPGNGGENDVMPEEDYDNLVSGLGGLNFQPKSCLCNYPNQQENCPEHNPKGGPQAFEPQQSLGRNGYNMRGDVDPNNCSPVSPRRQIEDPCPEFQMPQMGPQQRNDGFRTRSGSPNRPQECPPEEKRSGFPEPTGVCICNKPPCTCPCLRATSPQASSNANSAGAGGRPPPETSRRPVKTPKQDVCGPEGYGNRGAPNFNGAKRAPDNCPPMGPPNAGVRNRQGGPGMRSGQAEVLHCYDARNPDPALIDKIDSGWMDVARERGNKRLEADYQSFMAREQSPGQSMQNSRRGLCPPGQPAPIAQDPCGGPSESPRPAARFSPPQVTVTSPTPPIQQQEQCDYLAVDEPNAGFQAGNQRMNFGNQLGFMECEAEAMPPAPPNDCYEQRPKQGPCGKSPSQAMGRPKAYAGAQGGNDNSRMANIANALQGMKQRTEAHREKCDTGATRRSPPNDANYCTGNVQPQVKSNRENCKPRSQMAFDNGAMSQGCQPRNARQGQQMYPQQAKQAQQCGPSQERGYVNLSNTSQMKQCVPQQQPAQQRQQMKPTVSSPMSPECYPNNQPGFQEFEFQEELCEADLAAYDSLDACRPESPISANTTRDKLQRMQQGMTQGTQQGRPQGMQQGMTQGTQQCRPQGMQQGMPQGMQQGMTQGTQQCRPQGMQQGMTQGMQQGMTQGTQQCMPQGMQQGTPQGMQQGMTQGMQQGMPQGMQQGMPQGMQQGMTQGTQQCMPQGMQQGTPQRMQQGTPQRMQQGTPQRMQQGTPQRMQQGTPQRMQVPQALLTPTLSLPDCTISTISPHSGAPECETDNGSPQWVPMRGNFLESLSPRSYQDELGDDEGRCMRSARGQPQSDGPSSSCSPSRISPSRTSPGRTSPSRSCSPRNSPGTTTSQDSSPCSATPDMSNWSTRAQASRSISPEVTTKEWASPRRINNDYLMFLGGQDVQTAPCALPSSPAPNMPYSRQNGPQQRSAPNYSNYPQQTMNANLQFQEIPCVDDMTDDMGNMDMNDMECPDQQNYALQNEMCENDGDGAWGDVEDNGASDEPIFMTMKSTLDGAEDFFDDYQDMNDCDPVPPPPNSPMNRPGGRQRNSGSQGQRGCLRPPPTDQCSGGITTIHRR